MIINVLLCFVIFLFSFNPRIQPAVKAVEPETSSGIIICFSGGKEILNKEMVSGPFADEYKFAHEVRVKDETGEHNVNFAGGLCIIDRGTVSLQRDLALTKSKQAPSSEGGVPWTDKLSCYSGASEIVIFEVYGQESTVDEYVEGRTFLAKAKGNFFNSDTLHEYLVFGGGACIGTETS